MKYWDPTGHISDVRGAEGGGFAGMAGDKGLLSALLALMYPFYSPAPAQEPTIIPQENPMGNDPYISQQEAEFENRVYISPQNRSIENQPFIDSINFQDTGIEVLTSTASFALGLRDYLDDFAASRGAQTWKHFDEDWRVTVLERLNNPNVAIEFNLTGIDSPWASVSRAARGAGGATDWELLQIKSNPQTWDKITWYENGKVVSNPFE